MDIESPYSLLPRAAAEQTITLFGQDVLPRLSAAKSAASVVYV
jgi:hypothetical protein